VTLLAQSTLGLFPLFNLTTERGLTMTINTNRPEMFTDDAIDTVLPFELHLMFDGGYGTIVIRGTHNTATSQWKSDTPTGLEEALQNQVNSLEELAITDFLEIGKPAGNFDDTDYDGNHFSGMWMLIKGNTGMTYLGN
jgi:hypothetical protein